MTTLGRGDRISEVRVAIRSRVVQLLRSSCRIALPAPAGRGISPIRRRSKCNVPKGSGGECGAPVAGRRAIGGIFFPAVPGRAVVDQRSDRERWGRDGAGAMRGRRSARRRGRTWPVSPPGAAALTCGFVIRIGSAAGPAGEVRAGSHGGSGAVVRRFRTRVSRA